MKELSKSDLALLPHFKSHLSEKTDERSVRLLALINKRLANESLADDDLKILKLGVQLYRAERSKLAKAKRLGAIESNEKKQAAKARNHRLILLGAKVEMLYKQKIFPKYRLEFILAVAGILTDKDYEVFNMTKFSNDGFRRWRITEGDYMYCVDEVVKDGKKEFEYYHAQRRDDKFYIVAGTREIM